MTARDRDEHYVLDICDRVLGIPASRQRRLPFLVGDPGPSGRRVSLPIDAYYESLRLAVEYRERQHTEPVGFWDRKPTVSGCSRGEQRRRYDERRRIVLPLHGITLVELDYSMFAHDSRKRLRRDLEADEEVISLRLGVYISSANGTGTAQPTFRHHGNPRTRPADAAS
jgi:hypothetical protein